MTIASPSTNPIQEVGEAWAVLYPLIHWVIIHPVASLLLLLLGLYLIWVFLRGLVFLTEKLWMKVIKFPLWVIQTLWAGRQLPAFLFKETEPPAAEQARDRLQELITQMEASHQQQAQLLDLAKEELRKLNQG